MILSMVWAEDEKGCIGDGEGMPWDRLPADLAWFRKHTLGKTILMGRKTYETLPGPLTRRHNIILTRQEDYPKPACATVAHTPEDALRLAFEAQEVVIIGGAEIYALYLDKVTKVYRTTVHGTFEGSVKFPSTLNRIKEIDFRSHHERRMADQANPWDLTFEIFEGR